MLTAICPGNYSAGMATDLIALAEKINRLAELAQALRGENADLRLRCAALTNDNADLSRRMQEASQRIVLLLDQLPASSDAEETA